MSGMHRASSCYEGTPLEAVRGTWEACRETFCDIKENSEMVFHFNAANRRWAGQPARWVKLRAALAASFAKDQPCSAGLL